MVVMVFANVVLRYGFGSGITVSEEISRFLFVWLIFLGSVPVMRQHGHLGVEMLVGMLSVTPASAVGTGSPAPRYHELACSVSAKVPRAVTGPRRLQGRAATTCTNGGSPIDEIVIWTFLQWWNGFEDWQTIELNKVRKDDVASGTTLKTSATRSCDRGRENFLFRTKVTVWVYDSYGDLQLKETKKVPRFRAEQVACGTTEGF